KDSLRELITPGVLAVLAPIAVGFGLGVATLAGFLAGAIGTGTLMAIFLANSGGAWDNAKKLVEDGHHGGKGSPAHEATIIGDTVGDPFKDTAGPAINPLIKVMNLVSLLIASAVVSMGVGKDQNDAVRILIALAAAGVIAGAVYVSKRRSIHIGDEDEGTPGTPSEDDDHVAAGTPVGNPAAHPSTPASAPAQSEPATTQQFEPPGR
ncbi:MAG: sodium/proton-translocating pyrophosphatase, partial [Friedmanniella sp.]